MTLNIPFDNSYARLPDRFFARLNPTPVTRPGLVAVNDALAIDLGIDPGDLRSHDGLAVLAGNTVPDGSTPIAQAYAGHQFGGWSPRLGDGRAHLLGEVLDRAGNRRDIQLKGSGPTPFSRMGDGRAWVGPVLREYLVSEAMHCLGVPTTRALAAVTTGQTIRRETALPGAVLTRVAASHIRIGTFQYFAARKDEEALEILIDHAIGRHDPDAARAADPALAFFASVIARQASLVAHWMSLGFIHGVMNTDNTTISGETIDYGPCAFIDDFTPDKVFSSIDAHGRYAYQNQPDILIWNLAQLGGALLPLMRGTQQEAAETATAELRRFQDHYMTQWLIRFRAKLGLGGAEPGDEMLIRDLLDMMAAERADFTNTFRALNNDTAQDHFLDRERFNDWHIRWTSRRDGNDDAPAMDHANPAVIPRNHRIEEVITAAVTGDLAPFENLHRVLSTPFTLAETDRAYARPPNENEEVKATFCGT